MKRVIAVQMSGSQNAESLVFKQSVKALVKDGFDIDLITDDTNSELLTDTTNIKAHYIRCRYADNKVANFIFFLAAQIRLFIMMIKMVKHSDTVYINSANPFAAALVAKLNNAKTIYHLQNAPLRQGPIDNFLRVVINYTAEQVIFTSANLKDRMHLTVKKQVVLYQTPTRNFINKANSVSERETDNKEFTVLMISPLKEQKGIAAFVDLASSLPLISFKLVLTDGFENLKKHKALKLKPANLTIDSEKENLHPYYETASMVVNLSKTDEYLESDDVNILHAMYYGKPVIVPDHGGLKELISSKKHGVAIDSNYLEAISTTVELLRDNKTLYKQLSEACRQQALLFNPENFGKQISSLFNGYKQPLHTNLNQLFGNQYFIAN